MLKGKDLLTLADLSREEIDLILGKAREIKGSFRRGELSEDLKWKSIALIFEKPSTRTRVSFGASISQLGGTPLFLSSNELQISRGETLEDTGKVLSQYVSAIVMRTFSQERLERLAEGASVPVINALSDNFHPCQALADLYTVQEHFGSLSGIKIAYVGDGNNVCHSLLLACSKLGVDISVASPEDYKPHPEVVSLAKGEAKGRSQVEIVTESEEAVKEADVVYTDVWASMGQENEYERRKKIFAKYQVNSNLLSKAKSSAIFMHCLPVHRGEEATAEVVDGERSLIWIQAENRLHTQKAILTLLVR
jgi:ornithine carbamoyltransferase